MLTHIVGSTGRLALLRHATLPTPSHHPIHWWRQRNSSLRCGVGAVEVLRPQRGVSGRHDAVAYALENAFFRQPIVGHPLAEKVRQCEHLGIAIGHVTLAHDKRVISHVQEAGRISVSRLVVRRRVDYEYPLSVAGPVVEFVRQHEEQVRQVAIAVPSEESGPLHQP